MSIPINKIPDILELNDIIHEIPNKENLDNIKQLIDNTPREQLTDVLNDLTKNFEINPNNNVFVNVKRTNILN